MATESVAGRSLILLAGKSHIDFGDDLVNSPCFWWDYVGLASVENSQGIGMIQNQSRSRLPVTTRDTEQWPDSHDPTATESPGRI